MKKLFLCAVASVVALLSCTTVLSQDKPFVIPEIRQWTASPNGSEFRMTAKSKIICTQNELKAVAIEFSDELQRMFGVKLAVVSKAKVSVGDIVLFVEQSKSGSNNPEAYSIDIDKSITVNANAEIGVLWATKTIMQLLEQSSSRSIVSGRIVDYPEYPMRGFMLDVGRKFFTMDYLEDMVRMMSYYKMNTFQVHLNDNAFAEFFDDDWSKTPSGFRLESSVFPGLASESGYYTKEDFRRFQKEALLRGVTVIPEIDAPAHTLAFSHYLPEIGSKEYGMDHLDLFNPKTYEFMDALLKEYLEGADPVFVNPYVHIGTDEYSNKDTAVVEKFRYFTDRYIKYVESFGKKAALWGALTHAKGETPVKVQDVLMGCWYNGFAEPKAMIEAGYDVLSVPDGLIYIVPATGYYHDYLNTERLYSDWTPAVIGNEVFEERHPQIKGGMFAVWNDHHGNGISHQDVQHRVYPAMQTLAVKMWDGKDVTLPFEKFDAQRVHLSEAPGVNRLGRMIGKSGTLFSVANPQKARMPLSDVGYDSRVEFELHVSDYKKGDKLFESQHSVFYLADPSEGKLGFSRDGYDYRFNYVVPKGHRLKVAVESTNNSTKLFIDGQLIDTLEIIKAYKVAKNKPNSKMNYVQTLMFPLETVHKVNGTISNLSVSTL